jgi:hypothetical protein
MNKARIKEEAEHFFEWPDQKRRDHVTLASCLIFAEVIAGMAVDAEREACAKVVEIFDRTFQTGGGIAGSIRARGMK